MEELKNMILNQLHQFSMGNGFKFLGIVTITFIIGFALMFYFMIRKDEKFEKEIFIKKYKSDVRVNYITDVILKDLKSNLIALASERGKPKEFADTAMNVLLVIIFGLSVSMLVVKQPVFAILLPFILLFAITKITGLMKKSFDEYVMQQLPDAIDNTIRVFSGYNDLKTVLYEASKTIEEPMKGIFQDLSRRMTNETPDKVLEDFMASSKNLWIYSFCFNLISYVEDAQKEDMLGNLRELKEIISRNNQEKNKQKVERKMTTSVNYLLCVIAFAAFMGNIMFNRSVAIPFFFGTLPGIACFLLGMTLLIISIFSNLLIGSGKD
ncbi:MAG: hypothetical protein RSC93_04290 [Erysipelotrichaceae bacterium]